MSNQLQIESYRISMRKLRTFYGKVTEFLNDDKITCLQGLDVIVIIELYRRVKQTVYLYNKIGYLCRNLSGCGMTPAKILSETSTEAVDSKPFRAYMVDNSSSASGAKMFRISENGSNPTDIDQLTDTLNDSNAVYCDSQEGVGNIQARATHYLTPLPSPLKRALKKSPYPIKTAIIPV